MTKGGRGKERGGGRRRTRVEAIESNFAKKQRHIGFSKNVRLITVEIVYGPPHVCSSRYKQRTVP